LHHAIAKKPSIFQSLIGLFKSNINRLTRIPNADDCLNGKFNLRWVAGGGVSRTLSQYISNLEDYYYRSFPYLEKLEIARFVASYVRESMKSYPVFRKILLFHVPELVRFILGNGCMGMLYNTGAS
jgi:hypothetical protein